MESYYSMTHDAFMNLIGFNYIYPVVAYEYQTICNTALNFGYEVIAILPDGVIYKIITHKEII